MNHTPNKRGALAQEFIQYALDAGALRFGETKTKAGRLSPYFFNAGILMSQGSAIEKVAGYYANAIMNAGIECDVLFGPAYKGIPLGAATAMALAQRGIEVGFAYNRKEEKDHGEGGNLVGAPLTGRVLVIDDVISAGTSYKESAAFVQGRGGRVVGLAIALDRQEQGIGTPISAVQEVQQEGVPVVAIATLEDLVQYLGAQTGQEAHLAAIQAYRARYGAAPLAPAA